MVNFEVVSKFPVTGYHELIVFGLLHLNLKQIEKRLLIQQIVLIRFAFEKSKGVKLIQREEELPKILLYGGIYGQF